VTSVIRHSGQRRNPERFRAAASSRQCRIAFDTVFSPTDTIVAIATPPGRGGIGVVRISGPRAADIARAILTTPHALLARYATHTFVRPGSALPAATETAGGNRPRLPDDRAPSSAAPERVEAHDFSTGPVSSDTAQGFGSAPSIDEVVATFFPAPHSYTTEDVVEISAHGSPAVLREIVRAAIGAGARLAEPGEFTFRAYLGGRIDLVQAEAVGDLVDAVTPLQARVAFDQLEGTLTRSIAALDAPLFDLVARLEASIDFPDEGYHFIDPADVAATLREVRGGIDRLLRGARLGRVIREGRQIAIVGKPNVGKSSLFNWLLGAERAIVTGIPGTTRDLLRETVDFDGVRLSLVDTAGSRDVQDEIEHEGVARARRAHDVADLVCVMLDASRPLDVDDDGVLVRTARTPRLVIVNKIDLPHAWNTNDLNAALARAWDSGQLEATPTLFPEPGKGTPQRGSVVQNHAAAERCLQPSRELLVPSGAGEFEQCGTAEGAEGRAGVVIEMSLKTGAGLSALHGAIKRALEFAEPRVEEPLVTNIRHESLLRDARESIVRALAGLDETEQVLPGVEETARALAVVDESDRASGRGEYLALEAGSSDPAPVRARLSEELVLADLSAARRAFDEVVGKRTSEDVLRAIFERFCVGK